MTEPKRIDRVRQQLVDSAAGCRGEVEMSEAIADLDCFDELVAQATVAEALTAESLAAILRAGDYAYGWAMGTDEVAADIIDRLRGGPGAPPTVCPDCGRPLEWADDGDRRCVDAPAGLVGCGSPVPNPDPFPVCPDCGYYVALPEHDDVHTDWDMNR